jgi:hypothetical protein
MGIYRFNEFINEDVAQDLKSKLSNDNKEMKEYLLDKVQKSANSTDQKVFLEFIETYLKNPNDTQIEGFINDSDIYAFYLKYNGEIDEILSELNFYDEKPSDIDCFSLYDYVVKGTLKSIKSIVEDIKKDLSSVEPTQ